MKKLSLIFLYIFGDENSCKFPLITLTPGSILGACLKSCHNFGYLFDIERVAVFCLRYPKKL